MISLEEKILSVRSQLVDEVKQAVSELEREVKSLSRDSLPEVHALEKRLDEESKVRDAVQKSGVDFTKDELELLFSDWIEVSSDENFQWLKSRRDYDAVVAKLWNAVEVKAEKILGLLRTLSKTEQFLKHISPQDELPEIQAENEEVCKSIPCWLQAIWTEGSKTDSILGQEDVLRMLEAGTAFILLWQDR